MILDQISNPDDLKKISPEFLPEVCESIRERIIDVTSQNGGHLAPSLGVVELTVALHYSFNSPADKMVWDVGHQAYAHKILTGRRDSFSTLRQKNGLSGFPKISENPHDVFGTGHSSTSISAALGIAKALEKKGESHRAIAVIGDGSMTGGLAFEALNQAGHRAGNLVIILNDNEMSISPNVGAMSKFFSIHIHGRTANKARRMVKKLLLLIPIWGKHMYRVAMKAEEAAVGFLTPGHLFESFGCDYIGPLNGHNLNELIDVFNGIKESEIHDRPILVHVSTKKGKGYLPAETNPTLFHGIGPFDRATGKPKGGGKLNYTKAFSNALCSLAKDHPEIVGITAAMPTGTGLEEFRKQYPDRFYDVGIAEGHATTFAAGLATQGCHPVVAIYSTFLQRAFDNIIHDVCLQRLPVTFAIDRAGVVGDDGPTHHGTFDLTYLRMIPNMIVMAPRDEIMMEQMLHWSVDYKGPTALRYPRGAIADHMPEGPIDPVELGRAEIVNDAKNPEAIIIAVGHLVGEAMAAAERLKEEGIQVVVVDPRFIKPFDFGTLEKLLDRTKNVITLEENALAGGLGSMVSEWVTREGRDDVQLTALGLPDHFVEHASQPELRAKYGIDAQAVVSHVMGSQMQKVTPTLKPKHSEDQKQIQ